MNIEITSLADLDAFPLSHSAAEGGQDAGRETWQASLSQAEETPLLDTPDKLQAMRDFARASGGWDDEEVAAWTPQEVNALFLQWIAGDVRQCPAVLCDVFFEEYRPGEWWYDVPDECGNEMDEYEPFDSRSDAYTDAMPDSSRPPHAESLEEIDWPEYEAQASAGRISGNLFRADDGRIYFYLGN